MDRRGVQVYADEAELIKLYTDSLQACTAFPGPNSTNQMINSSFSLTAQDERNLSLKKKCRTEHEMS